MSLPVAAMIVFFGGCALLLVAIVIGQPMERLGDVGMAMAMAGALMFLGYAFVLMIDAMGIAA